MEGLVDIYLADLKYLSEELAQRYSHAKDYPETAKAAIKEMVRQVGDAEYKTDTGIVNNATEYPDGAIMRRGVIVRHLLLPMIWLHYL
jgi:putative pyruvate formate lyase activating enzyme